jgi:ornithine carbamoyltransferase
MTTTKTRHIFDVDSLTPAELEAVLGLAEVDPGDLTPALAGQGVALLFEKPSARTRNSTEMAVVALGGHPVYIQGTEVGLDVRETAEDVARTLACYHSIICARVMDHRSLTRMAAALDAGGVPGPVPVPVPVVNLLSDVAHPCQALADLLTLRHEFGGSLEGRTVAYIGDANNVWLSLALAGAMVGLTVKVASPKGYGPSDADLERIRALGGAGLVSDDPADAVAGADAVYTDVWTSMGQEEESGARLQAFAGFTVDEALMKRASPEAIVLHCLPAHRGEEIAAEVVDGPQSRIWPQAANRMHAMRGLLAWLTGAGSAGPAQPVGPAQPGQPAQSGQPAQPVGPAQPGQPDDHHEPTGSPP